MTPLPRLRHPHDGQGPPLMLSEYSPTTGQAARQPSLYQPF
jgi:hypothetical protein